MPFNVRLCTYIEQGFKMLLQHELPTAITNGIVSNDPRVGPAQCETCIQTLLLKEGNHRIANSLQLASSVLFLRAREAKSLEARAILDEVASEIRVIGQMHRKLCELKGVEAIDITEYIAGLCADIEASAIGASGAKFSFKADSKKPVYFKPDRASQIGLVVTELLINSAKHAGTKPLCSVVASVKQDTLELNVSDNGPGFSKSLESESGPGIGLQVLKSLVAGLKGTLAMVPSVSGARFLIKVPVHA